MDFESTREQVTAWRRSGKTQREIAALMAMPLAEVRGYVQDHGEWNPSPAEIEQATAAIRASWTDRDWEAACRLNR